MTIVDVEVQETKTYKLTLTLSQEEAEELKAFTGSIAGTSRIRPTISAIYDALDDRGVISTSSYVQDTAGVTLIPVRRSY